MTRKHPGLDCKKCERKVIGLRKDIFRKPSLWSSERGTRWVFLDGFFLWIFFAAFPKSLGRFRYHSDSFANHVRAIKPRFHVHIQPDVH